MPRRGRQSPTPRTSAPPRMSSRAASPPPAAHPPAPVPQSQPMMAQSAAQPKQPGMFAQMAATAGGVAVGSAIGHTVGHAMTGMFSGGGSNNAQPAEVQHQQQAHPQQGYANEPTGPCAWEIKQFLQCTSEQSDISLCQGFNEAIKACKQRYSEAGTAM